MAKSPRKALRKERLLTQLDQIVTKLAEIEDPDAVADHLVSMALNVGQSHGKALVPADQMPLKSGFRQTPEA